MTAKNSSNPKKKKEKNPVSNIMLNPDFRDSFIAEVMTEANAIVMRPAEMLTIAKEIVSKAKFTNDDLALMGIHDTWDTTDTLSEHVYAAILSAGVLGGVPMPKDFLQALKDGTVILAGGAAFPQGYPFVFADKIRSEVEPDASAAYTNVGGEIRKTTHVIFARGVDEKRKKKFYDLFQNFAGVKFYHSAGDLMTEYYSEVNIGQAEVSALIRWHAPKFTEKTGVFQFRRGYDVLNVRVLEDHRYPGLSRMYVDEESMRTYTYIKGVGLDGRHPYKVQADKTHDGVTAWKTMYMVLLSMLAGHGGGGMKANKAEMTEAWVEKEAGSFISDRIAAIIEGKVATLQLAPDNNYGFRLKNASAVSGKTARYEALEALIRLGIPCVAHKQLEWIGAGYAAEARGMGIQVRNAVTFMLALMKQDKAEKFLDRLSLVKPTAKVEGMERSAFQILLSNGDTVALHGKRMALAYANTGGLTNGSGNAISRPGFKVKVLGDNRVKVEVTLGLDCGKGDAEAAAMKSIKIKDKGFTGDVVITQNGKPVYTFEQFNSNYEVTKHNFKWDEERRVLVVSAVIEWSYESETEKGVMDGTKFRFSPEKIDLFDAVTGEKIDQPDVLLDGESLKGAQGLLTWWAEAEFKRTGKPVVYDPNNGLTEEQQKSFDEFCKKNTRRVKMTRKVDHVTYRDLRRLYGKDSSFTFHGNNSFSWEGDMTFGEAVVAIEYSTTFQAVGDRSTLFPELLYSLCLLNKDFSYLWDEKRAVERREAVYGLNNMIRNEHDVALDEIPPCFDLTEGELPLYHDDCEIEDEKTGKMIPFSTGKQYLDKLAKLYPTGFYISFGPKYIQYVDTVALKNLTGAAGTLNPVVSNLLDIVTYFLVPEEKRPGRSMDGQMGSYFRRMKRALFVMAQADGVRKRGMRTGKLLTRKVSTVSRYGVNAWELHVNPNDPAVLNGDLKNGQKVGFNRVPMIFWGACVVVLNPETPIGVFEVNPYCWAAIHEGDSDGDSIAVLILPKKVDILANGIVVQTLYPQQMLWDACHESGTRMSASGLNYDAATGKVSPLTGGYVAMYGADPDNHPYTDFLRQPTKKNIRNLIAASNDKDGNAVGDGIFNAMVLPALPTLHEPKAYVSLCRAVGTHYGRFVGGSYGMATIALYLLSIAFERNEMDYVSDLIPVVVFTARYLHEGKHLCGTNDNAASWWAALDEIVNTDKLTIDTMQGTKVLEGAEAMRCAVEEILGANKLAKDALRLTDNQLFILKMIRRIAIVGNAADRYNPETKFNSQKLFDLNLEFWGPMFRFCRMYGQGSFTRLGEGQQLKDTAAFLDNHMVIDRLSSTHINLVAGAGYDDANGNPVLTILGKVALAAYATQADSLDTLRAAVAKQEQEDLASYGEF